MKWVYNLTITFYHFLLIVASPFNSKAKRFIKGRKDWSDTLKTQLESRGDVDLIWVHAASQGEYQQGVSIIKELKKAKNDVFVLLSFFSPSGFESFEENESVDAVTYLPLDYPENATAFIDLIKPKVAVFVKYEFWYNYMIELNRQHIPLLLVSSIFRPDQMFFHSMGTFYLNALKMTDHFFVQDEHSATLLARHGINQVTVTGDSRLDQMISIKEENWSDERLKLFIGESLVLICGSIWPSDWMYLKRLIKQFPDLKVIIAPHEIDANSLAEYEGARWSSYSNESDSLLLIDEIGLLKYLYRYADIAYVGGALRGAVHNTIEPAVYAIPIIIAEHTKNSKFNEVMDLKDHGGLVTFEDEDELFRIFEELIQDSSRRKAMGQNNLDYVIRNSGATEKVMQKLQEYL